MAKSGTSSLPPVRVERIDDFRWRIPRQGAMRVDGLVYADDALMELLRGEEALRLVRPGGFDAVVADLHMAGMDGLLLTARLRAVDPALPVLLVTPSRPHPASPETAQFGAFEVVARPFSPEEYRVQNEIVVPRQECDLVGCLV